RSDFNLAEKMFNLALELGAPPWKIIYFFALLIRDDASCRSIKEHDKVREELIKVEQHYPDFKPASTIIDYLSRDARLHGEDALIDDFMLFNNRLCKRAVIVGASDPTSQGLIDYLLRSDWKVTVIDLPGKAEPALSKDALAKVS